MDCIPYRFQRVSDDPYFSCSKTSTDGRGEEGRGGKGEAGGGRGEGEGRVEVVEGAVGEGGGSGGVARKGSTFDEGKHIIDVFQMII